MPLCIDSSVPGALEAGLLACEGRPLLNSVTGEEERLELRPAAGQEIQRAGRGHFQRRHRHFAKTPTCALPWRKRSSNAPPISAFRRMTSWSIRW